MSETVCRFSVLGTGFYYFLIQSEVGGCKMASNKRKQDEKHLKTLREMVALPHNKQCFDCHQRGPTYINMTIGSYVCTACSGLL